MLYRERTKIICCRNKNRRTKTKALCTAVFGAARKTEFRKYCWREYCSAYGLRKYQKVFREFYVPDCHLYQAYSCFDISSMYSSAYACRQIRKFICLISLSTTNHRNFPPSSIDSICYPITQS